MDEIKVFNTHCCGEIGDVVTGIKGLKFNSPEEASKKLFLDKKWRNFFLNEPRGGVFKHCNIILEPSNKKADAGFVIMEPEDNPPMSGSNAISGIAIVGAIISTKVGGHFGTWLGLASVIFATVNVVGGFMVTDRMLKMFKKK